MRVLFILHGHCQFQYPAQRVAGGIERVELDQIASLQRLGLDFTLVGTKDSEVEGLPFIRTSALSKEASGSRFMQSSYFNQIVKEGLLESHDVVLTNRPFGWDINHDPKVLPALAKHATKIRFINHEPPSYLHGHPFMRMLQTNKWLTQRGGRVATVMADGLDVWGELERKIRVGEMFSKKAEENNQRLDQYTGPIFTDFFEVTTVSDSFLPVEDIGQPRTVNFTARPAPHKGALHAVRGAEIAGLLDDFVGHTALPQSPPEEKCWEKLSGYQSRFRTGRPYTEVIGDLAECRVFLQPTTSESAGGLVAFEAAAHGVPVITLSDTGKRWLEPYGLMVRIPDREPETIAKAIESTKVLSVEERREIAKQVREDFGEASYDRRLLEFLS